MEKQVTLKNMENFKEMLVNTSKNKIIENQIKELRNEMIHDKEDLDFQLKMLRRITENCNALITENDKMYRRTFQTHRLAIILLLVTNIITILQNLFF